MDKIANLTASILELAGSSGQEVFGFLTRREEEDIGGATGGSAKYKHRSPYQLCGQRRTNRGAHMRTKGMFVLIVFALGCRSEDDVLGEYTTERTTIVSGLGSSTAEGCGLPQALKGSESMKRYRISSDNGRIRATDLTGGCVLEARVKDGVVTADGERCQLDEQAPLSQLGVLNRTYVVFRLDPQRGTVVTQQTSLNDSNVGRYTSCGVSEERIVEHSP